MSTFYLNKINAFFIIIWFRIRLHAFAAKSVVNKLLSKLG